MTDVDKEKGATTMPDHLQAATTQRGFAHLPPIPSEYGGEAKVYESSSASGPDVWLKAVAPTSLNEPDGPTTEVALLLTAENAWKLAEQLMVLVANHYQGDARPEQRSADLLTPPDDPRGVTSEPGETRTRVRSDFG